AAEWDDFVREFAGARGGGGATHCHLWGWKAIIERELGHECIYLAARSADGALAGVLPLAWVSSRLFGSYLVSLPFLNSGGPLGDPDAVQDLVSGAVEIARTRGVELVELRSRRPWAVDLPVSHRKITVVRDLTPGDPGRVWSSLRAKVRSQIRRPERAGIDVRVGPDQVAPFFTVFSRHMRDLGTPTQPLRLFEALALAFPADAWFGCAYYRGRPIAAGCGFGWEGEFEMTWAAALSAYSPLAANMLLYWRSMEWAAQRGYTLFNFGRCTPGSGTHRFKQQWDSRDVPLWWYQYAGEHRRRSATPSPDRAFAWGPRLWKRLPLTVANLLGPRLVRLIP
ncbi:MAG: GNAT family N-acetyltransferase, partial [Gemmatimonadales bacterium]